MAGLLSLVLGYAMYRFAGSEPTWWAVAFILAGALSSAAPLARPGTKEQGKDQGKEQDTDQETGSRKRQK